MIKAVKVTDYLSPRFWPTWLALGLMRAVSKMPLPAIVFAGRMLGTLAYYLIPGRRYIGEINIAIAFPDYSKKQIKTLNKAAIKNIGIAAFELALSWWEHEKLLGLCEIAGLENLKQAQEQGKGVIILTAHFTCLEIGGPVLNHHVPFQVMYKRARNKLFDEFMKYHRGRLYKAVVDRHKPRTLIKGLKKGYAAWYAPDQDFGGKDALFVPFFGVNATSLTAPARFSKISGAPVVPYYIQRNGDNKGYKLTILPALKDFPKNVAEEDAKTINEVLEDMIMQNPEQYLWVHKRYKNRPKGEPEIYSK
jgi:Kdo2-lipid IVA lauroyltransferase/acyltransferase